MSPSSETTSLFLLVVPLVLCPGACLSLVNIMEAGGGGEASISAIVWTGGGFRECGGGGVEGAGID